MSDAAESRAGDNAHAFSVSEISGALKRSIEEQFGRVRVRGEIGRVSRPASGHLYLDLKDEKAVLSGVVWRSAAQRLKVNPEQGLEVICTGRLTTFPGQSKYQMVIEAMEPAGVGALMALLEERRKKLAAEGLFEDARKRPLPFLPEVIGVVTSPSGAVIRDILHRLSDRFPRHVLVWPSLVQGERAASQVAAAIEGFNRLPETGPVRRPDVLIIARGGGSLEDLWPFNEEAVVRAAAASTIPLISAVGHETDTTLIDFAADRRAPTPTAAAEMAVPVRHDLLAQVLDTERRLLGAVGRSAERERERLRGLERGLPRAEDLVLRPAQRLDALALRLETTLRTAFEAARTRFRLVHQALRPEALRQTGDTARETLRLLDNRLALSVGRSLATARQNQAGLGQRLRPALVTDEIRREGERSDRAGRALARLTKDRVERDRQSLAAASALLMAYSHRKTLERGFALVRERGGHVRRRAEGLGAGAPLTLEFLDGTVEAATSAPAKVHEPSKRQPQGATRPSSPPKTTAQKAPEAPEGAASTAPKAVPALEEDQGELF